MGTTRTASAENAVPRQPPVPPPIPQLPRDPDGLPEASGFPLKHGYLNISGSTTASNLKDYDGDSAWRMNNETELAIGGAPASLFLVGDVFTLNPEIRIRLRPVGNANSEQSVGGGVGISALFYLIDPRDRTNFLRLGVKPISYRSESAPGVLPLVPEGASTGSYMAYDPAVSLLYMHKPTGLAFSTTVASDVWSTLHYAYVAEEKIKENGEPKTITAVRESSMHQQTLAVDAELDWRLFSRSTSLWSRSFSIYAGWRHQWSNWYPPDANATGVRQTYHGWDKFTLGLRFNPMFGMPEQLEPALFNMK